MRQALAILAILLLISLPVYGKGRARQSLPLPNPPPNSISGNIKTFKYHLPFCKYYRCRTCLRYFNSKREANDEGYIPCRVCMP